MDNQIINNLAIEIANLNIKNAQLLAENTQLKSQLSNNNEEN